MRAKPVLPYPRFPMAGSWSRPRLRCGPKCSPIARWPGGNFVSGYDWKDGLGDPDKRPPLIGPVRPTLESNDVGIDEFMVMCRLLGAEPYVAINSGFGEARSPADLVEYTNGSVETPMGKLRAANGHPQPYHVKYWGIGNEM